jgi:diguanylate cyclase (GGDEF)-like protein
VARQSATRGRGPVNPAFDGTPAHGPRSGEPSEADDTGTAVENGRNTRSETESRFEALFEYSPVGVALSTLDGRFVEVNAAFRAAVPTAGPNGVHRKLEHLCRLVPDASEVSPLTRAVDPGSWIRDLRAVRTGTGDVARVDFPLAVVGQALRWVSMATVRIMLDGEPYLLTHLEDVTLRHHEEQRLAHLALRDGLTGLANRILLADRLEAALARARRGGVSVGVLYLDLDGFKKVNDTLGHDSGDTLLVVAAERISAVLRAGDTAARLGGDEFVVVAENVGTEAALAELTRRVEQALCRPVTVAGRRVCVRASIGSVLSEVGESAENVLRRADVAMFAIKRERRAARRRARSTSGTASGQLTLLQDPVVITEAVIAIPDQPIPTTGPTGAAGAPATVLPEERVSAGSAKATTGPRRVVLAGAG